MATRTPRGAPRADVQRPPVRREFPDLSPARLFDQRPAPRVSSDPITRATFAVRLLPTRLGEPAVCRYELSRDGEPARVVSDFGDYHECGCPAFDRTGECPHSRILIGLGLVAPARFALTAPGARRA